MVREEPAALLIAALERRDPREAARALHVRARLVIDAGGEAGGMIRGRRRVARALVGLLVHGIRSARAARVNGTPGIVVIDHAGAVVAVVAFDGHPRIRELWAWTTPEKLRAWAQRSG